MKKLQLASVVLALTFVACSPKQVVVVEPTALPYIAAECALNWDVLEVEDGNEASVVGTLLNRKHAPNTVGSFLVECIEAGWTGWR